MCQSSYHLGPLGSYRDRVAVEVAEDDGEFYLNTFPSDPYLASACLQKALRRGDGSHALAASRALLKVDPERLWRRLAVCAFEDFGLVDLGLTARVVAVAASKNFRLVHGEARVLEHLVGRLCRTAKDRRLDELYALGAATRSDGAKFREIEAGPLGSTVAPLVHEASRLIATCERKVPQRSFRSVVPDACERALKGFAQRDLVDGGLFELCLTGVKVSKCLLPLLLPIAIEATELSGGLGEPRVRTVPESPIIADVPAYAIDGFTRAGRLALDLFLKRDPEVWTLLERVPGRERFDALHHLVFYAEGGRCTPEVSDPLYGALRMQAAAFGTRRSRDRLEADLQTVERLLPKLHEYRAAILPGALSLKEDKS